MREETKSSFPFSFLVLRKTNGKELVAVQKSILSEWKKRETIENKLRKFLSFTKENINNF